MIKIIFLILFVFPCLLGFSQDVLVHTGTYQGKNVYVQNPFASNGIGFSTKKVTVNGEPITNDFVSSAFEIDLKKLNLEVGDSINIKLYHDKGCEPIIVNELALTSAPKLAYLNIEIDTLGIIKWCTTKEFESKTFYIEQYKWNKWNVVGQMKGTGGSKTNCYEFKADLHSGENTFRVIQETQNSYKKPVSSPTVEIESNISKIIMYEYFNPHDNAIGFSEKTHFEVFNQFGKVVMKGFGNYVDLYDFEYGQYFINFDNQTSVWFYNSRFKKVK